MAGHTVQERIPGFAVIKSFIFSNRKQAIRKPDPDTPSVRRPAILENNIIADYLYLLKAGHTTCFIP